MSRKNYSNSYPFNVSGNLSPQAMQVLRHLEHATSITNVEAHAVLKCRSVSRRITELRDHGIPISKEHRKDSAGQRYVRYVLH